MTSLRRRALQMVNAYRVAAGLLPLEDLRRGNKNAAHSCPIANSLSELGTVRVGGSQVSGIPREHVARISAVTGTPINQANGTATLSNPPEFSEFVTAFDRGEFPQYVA